MARPLGARHTASDGRKLAVGCLKFQSAWEDDVPSGARRVDVDQKMTTNRPIQKPNPATAAAPSIAASARSSSG